jgi:hypothetical protein
VARASRGRFFPRSAGVSSAERGGLAAACLSQGTKRSLLSEGRGVPVSVVVAGANRNDFKLLRETVESIVVEPPEPTAEQPQGMCLDNGYDFSESPQILKEFGFIAHVRARGEEAQATKREAGFKARRWVVERTHRFRAILIRWEKKAQNYLALLHFACAYITFRQSGLLG